MIDTVIVAVIALFFGAFLGILVMALMTASRGNDEPLRYKENTPKIEDDPNDDRSEFRIKRGLAWMCYETLQKYVSENATCATCTFRNACRHDFEICPAKWTAEHVEGETPEPDDPSAITCLDCMIN